MPSLQLRNFNCCSNISLLIIIISLSFINSDLPVHCPLSDTIGKWEFTIDLTTFTPSLKNEQTTCGHGFPNKIKYTTDDAKETKFPSSTTFIIELRNDYKVYENNKRVGTWTPVFDQSFLINYKDSIITAPFKYFLKDMRTLEFVSDCGKSLVGWYIPNKNELNANWSCFYAKKVNSNESFLHTISMNPNMQSSFVQIDNKTPSPLMYQVKYEDLNSMVEEINEAGLTWKAEVNPQFKGKSLIELSKSLGLKKGVNRMVLNNYEQKRNQQQQQQQLNTNKKGKTQSTIEMTKHTDTVTYEEFMSKLNNTNIGVTANKEMPSFIQKNNKKIKKSKSLSATSLRSASSLKTHKTTIRKTKIHRTPEPDSQYVTDPNEITKYINTPINEIDEKTLPLNWDWRNVGGESYVSEPEEQGDCGSCYTFSTIFSLESRLRVKTHNKDKTRFSIQFPISCNFYSEGCDGGYPILVGKFLSEFEIIPRECFEYTQSNNKCSNVCDYEQYPKKYIVSDYGYLGGFYGGTSEVMMMKEIRARGPIPGNIKVPMQFSYYKNGIFSTNSLKNNSNKLSKVRMVDKHLTYEKVEHSVVIVGYGEENGVKYWVCMNTWGSGWGDKGFFKILRGENEQNIETMGDYINIDIVDRKSQQKIQ